VSCPPDRNARALGCFAAALLATVLPGSAPAAPWTALHFSTGTSFNHTLAVGDLDADGKPDVANANSQLSAVTVLLGAGGGALAPFQSYPTFSEPQDVIMGEFTGDTIPDLATPDYTGNGVTVLRGLGDGTFAPRVAYPVGPGLISLAAVDLDGDNRLDLAISKESGNKIAVLPALAGGGFGTAIEIATGSTPHQIAAADFNHDGDPDLAVASHGAAAASVHLGNGTFTPGAATPFPAGALPVGITLADLNGDTDLDMVVSNVNAATISVLLGNGDGTFAAAVPYATDPRPRGMDAGDLDGDGVPEVAVATGYPDGDSLLTLYRGVGDGTLQILDHIALPYRAADCVIADMNADGRRDIVVTGPNAGVVTVLLNPGGTLDVPDPASPGALPEPAAGLELAIHPNPVRTAAALRFRVPGGSPATLEIFDPWGARVASLDPREPSAGWQVATWRGERIGGGRAEPGLYFARLRAGAGSVTKRLVLLGR